MSMPTANARWVRWLWLAAGVIVGRPDRRRPRSSPLLREGGGWAVTGFFSLVLTYNTGAAFSFLATASGWQRWVLAGIAIAAAIVIVVLLRRGGSALYSTGLALILGGALGNLYDRLVLGKVVDFLLFHYAGWAYPAFNVADSAITVGAALLILDSFRRQRSDRGRGTWRHLMDVLLANPRGFCAGVDRAIAIVEQALANYGAPIYVRHEVVHNRFVVDDLKAKGAVFVEDLDEVPARQHGGLLRARRSEERARRSRCARPAGLRRDVPAGDQGPCRSREDARAGPRDRDDRPCRASRRSRARWASATAASISSNRSPTSTGFRSPPPTALAYVTQTTLSVDDAAAIVAALKARFPRIVGPKKDDICYATQNRQDAVKFMTRQADVVIVVGSPNSSNSNRLREVAANRGVPAYMIDRADQLRPEWVAGKASVGVTAGASAPEVLVREVLARLAELGAHDVRELEGVAERVVFPLPKGLHGQAATKANSSVGSDTRQGVDCAADDARPSKRGR